MQKARAASSAGMPPGSTPGARRVKENRSVSFLVVTLVAGVVAAIAAQLLQAAAVSALHHQILVSQIPAQALFPAVGPVHKVTDVYDLAPPEMPAAAPNSGQQGSSGGSFPVINFPAGPLSAIEAVCEAAKQAAENMSEAYKQNVEAQCEAAKQRYELTHP